MLCPQSLVIGCITFREDGDYIDCSKMGLGGKSIPGLVDKITDIEGTAKFVLLVRCWPPPWRHGRPQPPLQR